jgi:DNA invertase Pin-like site-specific DNA recombinase
VIVATKTNPPSTTHHAAVPADGRKRAAIYARVSSEEQASEDRYSITAQIADCTELAARSGIPVVATFVDDQNYRSGKRLVPPSGWRHDRPAWLAMLDAARSGEFDVLLAWNEDRLCRGYRPMVDLLDVLENTRLEVMLARGTFDRDTFPIKVWAAKAENERRAERIRMGHLGRVKRGLPHSNAPLGYVPVRDTSGMVSGYEIDRHWQARLYDLARLFVSGMAYERMAHEFAWPDGRVRSASYIRGLMRNTAYRGALKFNSKHAGAMRVQSSLPPMFDEQIARRIESELARRALVGKSVPRALSTALFSTIVCCGYCSRPMSSHVKRKGAGGRYYWCAINGRAGSNVPKHEGNYINERKLKDLINATYDSITEADIDDYMARLAAPAPVAQSPHVTQAIAKLSAQAGEIERDLERVSTAAARAALESELAHLRDQITELENSLPEQETPIEPAELRRRLIEFCADKDRLNRPDSELRPVLLACLPKLYVREGELVVWEETHHNQPSFLKDCLVRKTPCAPG